MTGNEIIKALECCEEYQNLGDCRKLNCPCLTDNGCYFDNETQQLKASLGIINSQKAEIERLQKHINGLEELIEKNRFTY